MAARIPVKVPIDPQQEAEFDRAFELLRELVDWSAADREFPVRGNAVYTSSVVLWMLVSQRMNPERSLESAVKRLVETQPDFLPRNKRVFEETLSENTGAYSRARTRLQRDAAQWFAQRVSQSLIDATGPSWDGRRVYMVDGTTITLAPEPALRREFPPATNQHGVGEKFELLKIEFRTFVNTLILIPCRIVKTGRRIVYRLLAWNDSQPIFWRMVEVLEL